MRDARPDTPAATHAATRREQMLQRARDLLPAVRERAAEAERLRRVPDSTVRDLHESGLWRINQPARVGGGEFDYRLLVEITTELARGCGSTGWVYVNLAVHHWMLAMWPAAAQDCVWDENPDALIASSVIYPCGRAVRVDGGYRLSGRWPFCSGIDHSEWSMVGAMVAPDAGHPAPEPRMFLVARSDLEVIDTWQVAGLAATGSKDVACQDLETPEHMTLAAADTRGDLTPGAAVNPAPLYRQSVAGLFPHLIASVILGMSRDICDLAVDRLGSRTALSNRSTLAEHETLQQRVAGAGVNLDCARLLLLKGFDESLRHAEAGTVPAPEEKLRWRRDGTHAAALSAEAAGAMFRCMGGGAIRSENPAQRHWRDINAGLAHVHVSWDVNGPAWGRVALGLEPGNPLI